MKFVKTYWELITCLSLLAVSGLKLKWEHEQLEKRVAGLETECKATHDWKIERESWQKFRERQKRGNLP